MGPIGEDPAILSGTARVQAGGTQLALEAATGFPAVNDLKRVEDDGGQPGKGADTTAEQVAVNPVEMGSILILYEAWKTRDVSDLSWVIIVVAASRSLGAGTPVASIRQGLERISNGLALDWETSIKQSL